LVDVATVGLRANAVCDVFTDEQLASAIGVQFAALVDALERPPSGGPSAIKVTVVEDARLPISPVSPRSALNLGLLLIGLAIGVGGAVLRASLDTTVQDRRAPARPGQRAGARSDRLRPGGQDAPADRAGGSAFRPRGGLSAAADEPVEGDLRRLRLADYLGLEGSVGLTTVLVGQTPLTDAAMLSVICSGTLLVVRHGRAKREQVKDRRGGLTPCRRPPLRSRPEHGADEGTGRLPLWLWPLRLSTA